MNAQVLGELAHGADVGGPLAASVGAAYMPPLQRYICRYG